MGSSKSAVVGYKYEMGVHTVLCHGPVDKVSEFIYGERSAWTGALTSSGPVTVNQPNLFGGDGREGGPVGTVDVLFGEPTQAVCAYLDAKIDGPVPAYRGVLSMVYRNILGISKGFQWSSGNPYFKNPWWRVTRVLQGWSQGSAWYPEKAMVGTLDMNPIHIVYECLTNTEWTLGTSSSDIDDTNFRAAADTIYNEGIGLSLMWMESTSVGDFINLVLRHVDGRLRYDIRTGKLQIKLIRDDYELGSLPELNKTNILRIGSFQRSGWGEVANEVYVKYTDRDQNVTGFPVQNLAAIDAQGSVIQVTREYLGARTPELATRLAMRDLKNLSTPLAKVELHCNRVAWDWQEGDVFRLYWAPLGITGAPFRVVSIDKGTLTNGEIRIEAAEDTFNMPADGYVAAAPSGWVDPINAPLPIQAGRAVEAPYWDVLGRLSVADISYLPAEWAFGELLAVRPTGDAYGFKLNASPNDSTYSEVSASNSFLPSGTLVVDMPIGTANVTFSVANAVDLDAVVADEDYFYIDNEAFAVVSVNVVTAQFTAKRAVLDTLPAAHVSGSRVYVCTGTQGADPTERSRGEITYYKALTTTGKGTLAIGAASSISIQFTGRAWRPYPPGNLAVNGAFPASPSPTFTGALTLSWAHRNRLQQTTTFTAYTTANIGPEPGVTYTVRVYNSGGALLRTYSGITGTTWTYPPGDDTADGTLTTLRVELESVRDTWASWQKYNITLTRV